MRLEGKVALVTGAARGIGAAIARRFFDEGAKVIVNDLNLEAARASARSLSGEAVAADVADPKSVVRMFEEVRKLTPRLDILVNNAGISGLEGRNDAQARIQAMAERAMATARGEHQLPELAILETSDEEWRRMQAVHVDGTFHCCREAIRIMAPQRSGNIVNMGSIMGTFGRGAPTPYCTAKAAILGFTRSLAHDVVEYGIRVNAIAPGWIRTDMTSPLELLHPMLEAQTPMRRLGDVDDIAWAAVYLASDEAKFMTGQVISPNGGWYMSQ